MGPKAADVWLQSSTHARQKEHPPSKASGAGSECEIYKSDNQSSQKTHQPHIQTWSRDGKKSLKDDCITPSE